VPISIPESLVVALPPILSPSSRTFVELTLVNWRRPWGARRLDFVIRAGSFNTSVDKISKIFIDKISKIFIDKISKFCSCRQQSDRFSSDHRRPSTSTISEYTAILFVSGQKSTVSQSAHGKSPELAIRSKFQEQKRQATEGNSHLEKSVKHPGVPLT
jgi:hypothetical protein